MNPDELDQFGQDNLLNRCPREGDEAQTCEPVPAVPFNNFFGNGFLSLLYRSQESSSESLTEVRRLLYAVSGKGPRHIRAEAALELGRFLRHQEPQEACA